MSHCIISRACALFTLAASVSVSMAATLNVPGTHASVGAALTAASPGDVIEITSNASAFVESLHVTKNNITIRGQAGLDPRPTIRGVAAPHPKAGLGPQRWSTKTEDNTFATSGVAVLNEADGLVLENLIVEADPDPIFTGAGVLDFRFGTNGTVTNCVLNGEGKTRGSFTANAHTFNNVHFLMGTVALEHQGGPGTLNLQGCNLEGRDVVAFFFGGTIVVENSMFGDRRTSNGARAADVGNQYGAVHATFRNSVFRKLSGAGVNNRHVNMAIFDAGSGAGTDNYGTGRWSPGMIETVFDHCDFIGSAHNGSVGLASGRVGWNVKTFRVTNCNFYNIGGAALTTTDFPLPGNNYAAGGTVDRFEDYNVFKAAQNNAPAVGMTSGGNSIVLSGEPLYLDPNAANLELASNSPAAALKAPSLPASTGSASVSSTVVPVVKYTVGHTGADHTSINAALAAATTSTNGALIEIIDNSAPYVEGVLVSSGNGVALQGAPSLNPRPTIRPDSATTYALRLSSPSRNFTARNLILDGTNLSVGNAMTLDTRDAGESMVENCQIIGGPSVTWSVFTQNTRLMKDCLITCANTRPAITHNLAGGFALMNCHVESAGTALETKAGGFVATNVYLRGDGSQSVTVGGDTTALLDLKDSIVTSNAALGSNSPGLSNNLIIVKHHTARRFLKIDNSDLIGSLQAVGPGASPTGTAIIVEAPASGTVNPVTFMQVKDSILFNMSIYDYFLSGNTAVSTIPGLTFDIKNGFEDYNAYKFMQNGLQGQGVTPGSNNLRLVAEDDLYANGVFGGDFRLLGSSQAATLNSTGTPAYAGSQGIYTAPPPPTSATDWALFQ